MGSHGPDAVRRISKSEGELLGIEVRDDHGPLFQLSFHSS